MSIPVWITPAGQIGVYPAQIDMVYNLEVITETPVRTTFEIISGNLPSGLSLRSTGRIYGIPNIVESDITSTFVVRVKAFITATETTFADRTFTITITGEATPTFTTPSGSLLTTQDSVWIELPIEYDNPIPDNPILIRVLQGSLPAGLEINESGLIRGYPEPPTTSINYSPVNTIATASDATNNFVTVLSTAGFALNRPIIFTGSSIGGIVSGITYYIKQVINATQITITTIPDGDIFLLNTDSGFMDVSLPQTTTGQPAKRQYNFTLDLTSPKGNDRAEYEITVVNQNLPVNQGGPGKPAGTRLPTILNTRPATYNIIEDSVNYGYYVLPPDDTVNVPGTTYAPTQQAYIGEIQSNNFFSFHMLGFDFDDNQLTYVFADLPSWMTGDPVTGWIYGTPIIPVDTIQEVPFIVRATKTLAGTEYASPDFNYTVKITNGIKGTITWITDSDLGTIYNASISYLNVKATSDVPLVYELASGSLPPNLTLTDDGELIGIVAYQPTDTYSLDTEVAEFTFTITAKASDTDLDEFITSNRTFTLKVSQEYTIPTDNLYIKCTPSEADRDIINSLLTDTVVIPDKYLYRSNDINFGKAKEVVYAHAYGIYASNLEEYLAAIQKNHYWKDITLGSLGTAVARDENNNILYEVVYSNIIDNLQAYDPKYGVDYRYSTSVSEEIYWPRFVDLNLGPWYTSSQEIYTSYIFNQEAEIITDFREYTLLTQDGLPILLNGGIPTFYTSLTPGYARIFYPNSLDNMRLRVEQELGVNYNFRLLPLWMTSQQVDGNTLGFTPAWVIAYTKPAAKVTVTSTQTVGIQSLDVYAVVVDSVEDLIINRPIVFSGNTFGNIVSGQVYYIKTIDTVTNRISLSTTIGGPVYKLVSETGSMTGVFNPISYAEIIKERIENPDYWPYKLNMIDFEIDRFTVDKQLTYDYDTNLSPNTWTDYPSATPTPVPEDSENFYVIFPRKTILPDKTQYNL